MKPVAESVQFLMKLYQLIYVSKCNSTISKIELEAILKQSRHSNEIYEITGMLVYDRGHFFQVLEGEYNQVETLFSKIQEDKRHSRVNRIRSDFIVDRFFPDWKMGIYNLEETADLDYFKMRSSLKMFQETNSSDETQNLAKYALQTFIDLKENSSAPTE